VLQALLVDVENVFAALTVELVGGEVKRVRKQPRLMVSSGVSQVLPCLPARATSRLLAEIVDDCKHFGDARWLHAYAGASPVTRATS
jgi:hypothetical protein